MIQLPAGTKIWIAAGVTDLRRGFDGLSAQVQNVLQQQPFAYSEDRKGEHPRQHLKNFRGTLQADAYAGFHHLYGNHIYEAACWAHARRKFHEIHVVHASPTTTEALTL